MKFFYGCEFQLLILGKQWENYELFYIIMLFRRVYSIEMFVYVYVKCLLKYFLDL